MEDQGGNFGLGSLSLGTIFDSPLEGLPVPGVADSGYSPALYVLDGANRLRKRLARLVRPEALIGLKVEHRDEPIRVTVALQVDTRSNKLWQEVYAEGVPGGSTHRVVEVSAQGLTRAVAVLAPRADDDGHGVRSVVRFDVSAADLGSKGILMLGLGEGEGLAEWARPGLLPGGAVGLSVVHVKVDAVEGSPHKPTLATGRPAVKKAPRLTELGFFAVNPDGPSQPFRLVLRNPRGAQPDSPGATQGRRKIVTRLAGGAGRHPNRTSASRVEVEAVSLTGETLLRSQVAPDEAGVYSVELPASAEPLLVRAVPVDQDQAPPWEVEVRRT